MALWFEESASPGHRLQSKVLQQVYFAQSPYQTIEVIDTEEFGLSLVLDGIMQTTTRDEFIYHEMMAYVPIASHPAPRQILIIGGGDGGLARDVLKFSGVQELDLVEIDRMVVDAAKQFLPTHRVAFNDPRLTIHYEDGARYIQRASQSGKLYDIILVDSTDPEGEGPGKFLYTHAFHDDIYRALRPGGIYVQHTGAPFFNPEVLWDVSSDVVSLFAHCQVYWCTIPSYPGGLFTFTAGSKGPNVAIPQRPIDWPTSWYTPQIHRLAFELPPFLKKLLPASVSSQSIPNIGTP
ncbi:MAG: polyamine aminopropyltransferase [Sulfobacillus sp.]